VQSGLDQCVLFLKVGVPSALVGCLADEFVFFSPGEWHPLSVVILYRMGDEWNIAPRAHFPAAPRSMAGMDPSRGGGADSPLHVGESQDDDDPCGMEHGNK
jgi:hypothetical protein